MRNDIWFRVHYPYGIALDIENQTFALFNRFYKRLGEGADVEYVAKTIPELLNFIPNKNVSKELKQKLEELAKRHDPIMSCQTFEERFFKVWFYNDATNPYAYSKRNVKHYNRYMELLDEVSYLLGIELTDHILTL